MPPCGHSHRFEMRISNRKQEIGPAPPADLVPNGFNDEAAPVSIELVDRIKDAGRKHDGDSSTRCHNASPSQRRRLGKPASIHASTKS
jgi:hypothetical protein